MMDFGLVGLEGLVGLGGGGGSETGFGSSDCEAKQRGYGGSGLFNKQERSSGSGSAYQEDWRGLKMARTEDLGSSKSMLMVQQQPSLIRSNSGYSEGQMLSFSNPKSDSIMISSNEATLPYYHHALSAYNRYSGLGSGGLNTSMHGALTGARGPFTPSQWMELEHQALIYKYINANVPIPSNLLLPIRKALNPSGFSSFAGPFRPNTLGWGSFHLGFSGNNDPEPGRCRRTDGKKWRCSRDAVADQKYCERHMNRGRHRSRKPVEGQTGHAAAGPATAKVMPMASSTPASLVPGGGASNSLNVRQHQVKNYQSGVSNPSANADLNRILLNNENVGGKLHDSRGTSMVSPTMNLKPKDTTFSNLKQHFQCEDSSRMDFGLVSSESLVNSSQKSSYLNCRNYGISSDLNNRESKTQDPLRHFMDDWPKNSSNSSSWPEMEESQLDRTQLSISIPMSSDFSSSTSSPNHEKLALSPLRLSRECNPVQMGLGVGGVLNEPTQRQANWIPISWESSVGGPLGEVLNNTSNTSGGECKNSSSALNLMTEGWDVSPHMELSPTGVLQKTAFGSLSNSSSVSSPRAETNLTNEGASLCDNLLGPTLVNSSSIPSLLGAG